MINCIKKFLPLMLSMIFLIAGCGSESDSAKQRQVVIAMQSVPNDEMIARSWYDKEIGEALGVKLVKLNYDSSLLIGNAMATGNIDIAIVGSAEAAHIISQDQSCEIFWIHNIEGENEALVVKKNSGINSLAELKGKRIAVTFGATVHYSLLQAMKLVGLSTDDAMLFDLQPPEIIDAWHKGEIDAAFLWQPALGDLIRDGRVLFNSRQLDAMGITTADVGIVRKEFARHNPDILKRYIELLANADEMYINQPEHAASIAAKNLQTTVDEARNQMDELVWIGADEQLSERYLGTSKRKGQFVQTLIETAHFLERNDLIDRAASDETFENAVNPSYVEAIFNK